MDAAGERSPALTEILNRLSAALPELPSKLSLAARFALDHPERIALTSMRGAAGECGVASPTMLRLARLMGFESYTGFKAAFQRALLRDGFGARAGALRDTGEAEGHASLVKTIGAAAAVNVERSFQALDQGALTEMADAIVSAATTYVVAAGSLHWVAAMMQATGRMAVPGLRVPRAGEASVIETIGAIGPDDRFLALGIAPYARSTVEALRFVKERRAKIMVITDRRSSPLLECADTWLLAETESPHYYPSIVAVVAVIEALLATIVARSDRKTLDRIKEIERLRERSGAYLQASD